MEFMKSWIVNITVVIIFVMLLDIMMPNDNMKRFVKVIMGLLIILVIIKPFIMAKDMEEEFQISMAKASAFIEQSDKAESGDSVAAFQNAAALDIYEQKLSDKIGEMVKANKEVGDRQVQVAVSIENDINSESFGEVKGVNVVVKNKEAGTIQASDIESVKINTKTVINKKQPEYNLNNSKLSQDLREDLENTLGLKNADIKIEIQE